MKTEKKAQIAAKKWLKNAPLDEMSDITPYRAFIAGYMAKEEITPGPWKGNPGYQPKESWGQRVDAITLDGGVITDMDANYLRWRRRAWAESIVKWRLYDEY